MGKIAKLKKSRRVERVAASSAADATGRDEAADVRVLDAPRHSSVRYALVTTIHLSIIICLSYLLGIYRIEAEDIFSNIVTGEYLWRTKSIPTIDPFSYTGPYPWLVNRPLPCLIFFFIHSWGGLVAVQLFSTGLCGLVYCLLYVVWARRLNRPRLTLGASIIGIMASSYWFQPRIYVFGLVYTSLMLLLVTSSNQRRLWWCLPLQVLWINSHPSAILGIFFIALWMTQRALIERRISVDSLFMCLGVVLANLISPNGIHNFTKFAEEIFKPHPSRANIFEWFSPFNQQMLHQPLSWWFFAACAALAWAVAASLRSLRTVLFTQGALLSSITLALLAAGCSRHIPFFYLALFGTLLTAIDHLLRQGLLKDVAKHHVTLVALYAAVPLLALKVTFAGYSNGTSRRYLEFGVDRYKFAEEPMRILKQAQVGGNIFCDYNNGAYFLYRMYPEYKVYIDGARLDEVYGEAGFARYMSVGNDLSVLEEEIARYDIRSFIIPLPPVASEVVVPHRFLSTSSNWVLAYFDDVNMLYVRRDEASRVGIPSYSFINPFVSMNEIIKSSPDAVNGLQRDFSQGEVINPKSVVFLVLRLKFLRALGRKDEFNELFKVVVDKCQNSRAPPACSRFFFNQTW